MNGESPNFTKALSIEVPLDPIDAAQVVSGSPSAGAVGLGEFDSREYGVWEHTVGVSTDVEVDEIFVVLKGSAILSFEDGSSVELRAGSVGRLREGQRTTWDVREVLRKIYFS